MRTTTSAATLLLASSVLLPAAARSLGAQAPGRQRVVMTTTRPDAPAPRRPAAPHHVVPAPPAPPAMPSPVMLTGITNYTILEDGRARADFGGAERVLHRCPSPHASYVVHYGRPWEPPASFIDRPPVQAPPMAIAPASPAAPDARRVAATLTGPPRDPDDVQRVYVSAGTMCYYLDPAGRFTVLRF